MRSNRRAIAVLLFGAFLLRPPGAPETVFAEEIPNPEGEAFFESRIRPVLEKHCCECHSDEAGRIKGGLALDSREGILRGGDSGPAVVAGELRSSRLIESIRYESNDLAMPPFQSGGKLPDAVIQDFEQWVRMGAPIPRNGAAVGESR